MSLEINRKNIDNSSETKILKDGEETGYKSQDSKLIIAARGKQEGGKVVITTNQGQRTDIEIMTGSIDMKNLGLKFTAR